MKVAFPRYVGTLSGLLAKLRAITAAQLVAAEARLPYLPTIQ